MAWNEPWRVFLKREFNRNWPFLVGFGITFGLVTKLSLSLTEEDAKKSPFVQRHGK
ncbi:ATP synthase small subunit 6, mitochondrial [Cryptomeria japonica]|uniref:ATP synthase small subunit 6, mitochondrial n=1 Tax=Cryptomeria japonica TaxID=3369 RepID=UPI0025AC46FE|nr:ATP synthase small subunit 6, mitochondrial [Cryptomeria japonica]